MSSSQKPERPDSKSRAIVISDLGGGGSQRVALRLAADWAARGRAVTVITLSGTRDDCHALPPGVGRIALGCRGISGNIVSALAGNLRRICLIRRAIRNVGAKEVVAFLAATNVLTILATRGLAVRLVISERNDPARQPLGPVWETARRWLYARADMVTANSRGAIETLSTFVPKGKLLHVPNPLPDWTCEASPPQEKRERFILSVGRLHRQKGHDRLLAILASSRARSLGWKLVILGEGPERPVLEELVERLDLGDLVTMPGYRKDVRDWYGRAGIYTMASRYEGTSNAVIEAVASGLPLLISDACGDGAEFARTYGCGFVIDADDVATAACQLDRLMGDEGLRREQAERGHNMLLREFAPEVVRRVWEAAFGGGRQHDR